MKHFYLMSVMLLAGAGCTFFRGDQSRLSTSDSVVSEVEVLDEKDDHSDASSTLACDVADVNWTYAAARRFDGNNASEFFSLALDEVDGAYQGVLTGVLSGVTPAMRVYEADIALYESDGELFGSLSSKENVDYADIMVACGALDGELVWRMSKNQNFSSDFYPHTDMTFYAHKDATSVEQAGIRSAIIASLASDVPAGSLTFTFDPLYQERYTRVLLHRTDTVTDDAYIWLMKDGDSWDVVQEPTTSADISFLAERGFPPPLTVF